MMKNRMALLILLFFVTSVAGCSDPGTKKVSFFEKGRGLYAKEEYVKARLEFKNAIQIDLKYAEAYVMLGKTEIKLKSFQNAFAALSKAVELTPDNIEAQVELGKLLIAGRAFDRAQQTADVILSKEPKNVEGLLIKATLLAQKEDFEEAKKILNGLLASGDSPVESYLLLASIESKNGRLQAAEDVIKLGLVKFSDEKKLHLLLTGLYAQSGRPSNAIDSLKKTIALDPDNTAYELSLAGLLWSNGQPEEAESIFSKLRNDPEKGEENLINIARFYASKKQFDKAEQDLLGGLKQWPNSFKVTFALAELYASTARTSKGIDLLKESLSHETDPSHPNVLNAKNGLARLYLSIGNLVLAQKYVQEVIDESSNNIEGHLTKGNILLLTNDGTGAISEFRTVINEKPNYMAGYVRLAEAYVQSEQTGLAYDILSNALGNYPDSTELINALAKLYAFDKNFVKAEELLKRIVTQYPADSKAKANLGDFYAAAKRYDEAEKEYLAVQQADPRNPISYLRLSRLFVVRKDLDKAISQLKNGFSITPQSNELLTALVQAALANKEYQTAEQAALLRIEAFSRDIYALNLLGKIYAAQKDFARAQEQFEKVIAIQPLWPEPHSNLAKLYLVQGKQDEAIAKFKANIVTEPSKMANYLFLGIIYEQTDKFEEAVAIYEKALAANESFWVAANNMAFLLAEHYPEKLEKALELANHALDLRPDGPEVMDTVGWVYFRKGDMDKARTLINKALEKSPDSPILNYHMAMVYRHDGRVDLEKKYLEKAMTESRPFSGRQNAEKLLSELNAN